MSDPETLCPVCKEFLATAPCRVRVDICSHQCCLGCFKAFVTESLRQGHTAYRCPVEGCETVLGLGQWISANQPDLLTKWDSLKIRPALVADKEAVWCPGPDCPYVVLIGDIAECAEVQCQFPGCGTSICVKCRGKVHPDSECPKEPKVSRRYRLCPQCGVQIERTAGCLVMPCGICKAEFCWRCRKILVKGDSHLEVHLCTTLLWNWPQRPPLKLLVHVCLLIFTVFSALVKGLWMSMGYWIWGYPLCTWRGKLIAFIILEPLVLCLTPIILLVYQVIGIKNATDYQWACLEVENLFAG